MPAKIESLYAVQNFIEQQLESNNCPVPLIISINVAIEEIFVNIVQYGFPNTSDKNNITINCFIKNHSIFYVQFYDKGITFNPLQQNAPDIDSPIEDRSIGGLGIYLARKIMDEINYEYKDGKNQLTLKKNISFSY